MASCLELGSEDKRGSEDKWCFRRCEGEGPGPGAGRKRVRQCSAPVCSGAVCSGASHTAAVLTVVRGRADSMVLEGRGGLL